MEHTLFIGNELNRAIDDNSWCNLIKEIASGCGVDFDDRIPLPFEFERIANAKMDRDFGTVAKDSIYSDIKKSVAALMDSYRIENLNLHKKALMVNCQNVITTNYDLNLEKALDSKYIYNSYESSKYLDENTSVINDKAFFHPHGVCGDFASICLGYEHYMGLVQHLRENINGINDHTISITPIQKILYGAEEPTGCWYEKFFLSNISILGLTLDFVESDLWWLITYRASQYYSNDASLRRNGKLCNSITFYDVIDLRKKDCEEDKNRQIEDGIKKRRIHALLKGMNINVRSYELNKSSETYKEAYDKILEDIATEYGRTT